MALTRLFVAGSLALLLGTGCRTTDGPGKSTAKEADELNSTVESGAEDESNADLDERLGKPHAPAYSKVWETKDGKTIRNPDLQHCIPGETSFELKKDKQQIWAALADGTLVLGEEVIVGTEPNGKKRKLGHPTLTNSQPARIAGEVRWNGNHPFINNKSGRYSGWPDRGPDQLNNAAALFAKCGWDVTTKYSQWAPANSNDDQ